MAEIVSLGDDLMFYSRIRAEAEAAGTKAWQARDLVMWDDSWTMHRATPFESSEQRLLRWCGVQEVAEV